MIQFMIDVTRVGSPLSMLILSIILLIFLWLHKKPHHFYQILIFMSLGGVSVEVLKNLLKEPRPFGGLITAYGYGFPSGHTTMATLFFLLIAFAYKSHIKNQLIRIAFIGVCIICIALISYSRIYLGVHSWIDVIGGYSLGLFWFLLSIIFYNKLMERKKTLRFEKSK